LFCFEFIFVLVKNSFLQGLSTMVYPDKSPDGSAAAFQGEQVRKPLASLLIRRSGIGSNKLSPMRAPSALSSTLIVNIMRGHLTVTPKGAGPTTSRNQAHPKPGNNGGESRAAPQCAEQDHPVEPLLFVSSTNGEKSDA
jgi:hypothetical protein